MHTKEMKTMSEKKGYEAPVMDVDFLAGGDEVMSISGGGGIELPDDDW